MIFDIEEFPPKKQHWGWSVLEAVGWVAIVILVSIAFWLLTLTDARAAELIGQFAQANWSRCSGSACWDESGDPNFPLPVTYKTSGSTGAIGVRASEVEAVLHYLGPGKAVVRGRFVDDQHFDEHTRTVHGNPPVFDETVDQWTYALTVKWAPRWTIADGVAVQPELGGLVHRTRWAINREAPAWRMDGRGWGATWGGGLKFIFAVHDRLSVAAGVEAYHRVTTPAAPVGGSERAPGVFLTALELRWSL